jgi:exodeoxyribonuclease VII large subunit
LSAARFALEQAKRRLQHALPDTALRRGQLSARALALSTAFDSRFAISRHRHETLNAQLELLAPQRTLERGYAIVLDEQGQVLRDAAHLQPAQALELKLAANKLRGYRHGGKVC